MNSKLENLKKVEISEYQDIKISYENLKKINIG